MFFTVSFTWFHLRVLCGYLELLKTIRFSSKLTAGSLGFWRAHRHDYGSIRFILAFHALHIGFPCGWRMRLDLIHDSRIVTGCGIVLFLQSMLFLLPWVIFRNGVQQSVAIIICCLIVFVILLMADSHPTRGQLHWRIDHRLVTRGFCWEIYVTWRESWEICRRHQAVPSSSILRTVHEVEVKLKFWLSRKGICLVQSCD